MNFEWPISSFGYFQPRPSKNKKGVKFVVRQGVSVTLQAYSKILASFFI